MLTFATPFLHRTRIRDQRSGIRDPGSGMNKYSDPDPGSGIREKTSRIRNTALVNCYDVK
jgi:hypothetical protein